jgi:hypothetical protein
MHFHRYTYFIGALGVAFGAVCFAFTLALPAATVRPKPDASPPPGTSDTVNRAGKGDRLRVIVRPPGEEPFEAQTPDSPSPKSLDGCESAFGQIDHSPAARLAQRCVT